MIGRLLCRIGIHKITDVTIKWRTGGPHMCWHGCSRCHRLQHAYIVDRRDGGYDVDWKEESTGPTWGYPNPEKPKAPPTRFVTEGAKPTKL